MIYVLYYISRPQKDTQHVAAGSDSGTREAGGRTGWLDAVVWK